MEFFTDMWTDGVLGKIILILIIIAIILIGFVIYALVGNALNYIPEGTVIDKSYTPAYTSFIYVNKVLVPQYHPDTYSVEITDGDKRYWFTTTKSDYNRITIGQYVVLKRE